MKKILVVEDDTSINEMVCELLDKNGYEVSSAFSGTEALMLIPNNNFALVLLDLMLPGKTGEQVLEEIRVKYDIPVIVLTAKADKETTVKLLRLGADDYLIKPFDNDELLARCDVQIRRNISPKQNNKTLSFKDITLDLEGYNVYINKVKINISKREFQILELMISQPTRVFTKSNIYESVWGEDFFGDDNTVSVHISKIRSKLNTIAPNEEYIQTIWGIGFKMKE